MCEKNAVILDGIKAAALLAMLVGCIAFPTEVSEETASGLGFCARVILPSLFASAVLSRLLVSLPAVSRIAERYSAGWELLLLILGSICGFPTGAVCARRLCESGAVSADRASRMLAFSNLPSASFCIGFVGETLCGSRASGLKLWLLQLAVSVIVMLVLTKKEKCAPSPVRKPLSLTAAVTSATLTMVEVCGLITFFSLASGLICRALSLSGMAEAVLRGALEFSTGCAAAGNNLPLIGAICGFSGVCAICQIAAASGGLSLRYLIPSKLVSAVLLYLSLLLTSA